MPLLDPTLLIDRLHDASGRFDVDAVDAVDSTNSELMRRADAGAASGSVLVADVQTAGRGRRGRHWLSTPADSLTFSVLWRFSGPPGRLSGLSLAVGVALADALACLGAHGIALKWPNDVLLRRGSPAEPDDAKLAGILVELSSDRRGTQAIIGIGINLQPPRQELTQAGAGLSEALAGPIDRHVVLAALLDALARVLDTFAVDGFAGLKTAWQARHAWQDQPVCLLGEGDSTLQGICRGADDDGALLLETAGGVQRIFSGDVSLRPAGSALGVRPAGSALGVRPAGSALGVRPAGSPLGGRPAGNAPGGHRA